MWPFKKNKENKPPIAIRYTYDVFQSLFPEKTRQDWEEENSPDNILTFIKRSTVRHLSSKNKTIERLLIITIDNQYIEWLGKNKQTHSISILNAYIDYCGYDTVFWSQKLIDSNMTTAYNVLGIPSMVMLYNLDGRQSQYSLCKETSTKIETFLKTAYKCDYVFLPGWITKGSEMPKYNQDIIQIARSFWDNGVGVRFGKYLEQNYTQYELFNKFAPLNFVVPFVIKTTINDAEIYLGDNNHLTNNKIEHAMTLIQFSNDMRMKIFDLIKSEIPQVVSIGTNAIMPGQAYMMYQNNIIQRCFQTKNVLRY